MYAYREGILTSPNKSKVTCDSRLAKNLGGH